VLPNGVPQYIDYIGANLWFVPAVVVEKIGIFPDVYVHGIADNDYCWRAKQAGFQLVGTPHYCAYCEADHHALSKSVLKEMSIRQRWKHMNSPKGQEVKQQLYFQRKFFPLRYPFAVGKAILRLLFGI
jgi:GT2 family glycosyltransferase